MQLALSIYGAVLSTTLGVLTVARYMRERPRISVEATPVALTASEGDDTHGVLVQVRQGDDLHWKEADVEICVRNAGDRACQISEVFVETRKTINQVKPQGLPIVLAPNTACTLRVQPEVLAPKILQDDQMVDQQVEAVGVFDALGKRHCISAKNLTALLGYCRGLPLRTWVYQHRETGDRVIAFQPKDEVILVTKGRELRDICR
jgi:hypothetical protein